MRVSETAMGWQAVSWVRLPPLAVAMIVTDQYVHLGSFLRECLVFLALWFPLDWICRRVWKRLR